MRRDIFVSVVVPLENDLDILPTVVRELDSVMRGHFGDYEIIFIDDGSSDGTRSFFERAKAEIPCFRYSRLTRPFGLEVAIAPARLVPFPISPRVASHGARRAVDYIAERAVLHERALREGISRYEGSPSTRGI